METASLRSTVLPSQSFPVKPQRWRRTAINEDLKRKSVRVFAGKRDYGGRLVDENMIILRKLIREMKMAERNYEPPSDWMDWEKRYYTKYDSAICEAVGFLQTELMNTRPSLALGVLTLLALSVPVSTAVTLSHLIEITKWILSGVHVN
ncbi:PREDICTED: uncharacterized protein LOC104587762 [Nelumbo nucifera]|uniref:Uncharacterized protein n=2 Tax=Nelumbo nucifera TaxID=4432 RepID=A0A822YRY8_NELNU|nr:PREDICTED: uncharacterized protein LOC104587762 [Nelumbo nucifera]DAD31978.1 TPA_asm: hypothetical protein HUJ06_010829 [Nelumbo nucifera]